MSREEFLPANPVHREDEMVYMELGARVAALDYMQDFRGDPVALVVGLKGMEAPDKVHRLLHLRGMGRNIIQFIRKGQPCQFRDPDAGLEEELQYGVVAGIA